MIYSVPASDNNILPSAMAVFIVDSDDNLKVLVPTLNLKLGVGVLRGSSKKNEPYKSP